MEEVVNPEDLSLEEGTFIVRLARNAVSSYLRNWKMPSRPQETPETLLKKGAAFVTLLKIIPAGERELRGCIGYVKAMEPLVDSVIHAAIAAATEDPRFPPVRPHELQHIVFEVSVLSDPKPVPLQGRDRVKGFIIGRDGLIIRKGFYSGLLLPEVPVEYCWDEETFLSETCIKAGLQPDCWLDNESELLRFSAVTFREERPGGQVIKRDLRKEYESKCTHLFKP